jgi:hypothetical protein
MHETFVLADIEAVPPDELLTVVEAVVVHPLASVTVTVYPPDATPVTLAPVCPLLHAKVSAPVPPVAVALTVPSACPQLLLVEVAADVIAGGSLMVTLVL